MAIRQDASSYTRPTRCTRSGEFRSSAVTLLHPKASKVTEKEIKEVTPEKVLCDLPAAVTNGTTLTVELSSAGTDMRYFNIKHRESFEEEKEPYGMVLSGWMAPIGNEAQNGSNGVTTTVTEGTGTSEELQVSVGKPGAKRKISKATKDDEITQTTAVPDATNSENPQEINDNDDDDDVVVLDENPELSKRALYHFQALEHLKTPDQLKQGSVIN